MIVRSERYAGSEILYREQDLPFVTATIFKMSLRYGIVNRTTKFEKKT